MRVSPPEPSDDDVYISAAQVRRCELVSGDRVSGPVRKPRRSERYPSLVRVDTINGAPAEEVAEGTPFDELPCAFPSERLELGSDDPTLKAIEWLTPIGRGSRVAITGGALAGKTETLRRLAAALAGVEGLELSLVLAGVRPEEAAEWKAGPAGARGRAHARRRGRRAGARRSSARSRPPSASPRAAATRSSSSTRSTASRPAVARRALAAARAIVDGGSLTVIATATQPAGRRDDGHRPRRQRAPRRATSPRSTSRASGTLRPELLVGDAGADAIAAARAEAD